MSVGSISHAIQVEGPSWPDICEHAQVTSRCLLILVNLRKRTGEERRRQTLCDNRDNKFVWNNFSPTITFL